MVAAVDVLGAWRLIGWTRTNADGRSFEPFGPSPFGRLIYDPGGLMSGFLMRFDWPLQPVDTAPQARWMIAYSGRYSWDGDVVSHHVDTSSDPSWIGVVLRRRAVLEAGTLTITTLEDRPSAPQQILSWVRETCIGLPDD